MDSFWGSWFCIGFGSFSFWFHLWISDCFSLKLMANWILMIVFERHSYLWVLMASLVSRFDHFQSDQFVYRDVMIAYSGVIWIKDALDLNEWFLDICETQPFLSSAGHDWWEEAIDCRKMLVSFCGLSCSLMYWEGILWPYWRHSFRIFN